MARGRAADPDAVWPGAAAPGGASFGWIPWFAENRLYILGWVQKSTDSVIYGVELEVMALLSRLIMDFPPPDDVAPNRVFALVDGNAGVLHQSGATPIEAGHTPESAVSLGPELPHWQVVVFHVGDAPLQEPGRSFLLLSGLLLAIFIIAILLGGGLLTWQALRYRKDSRRKTSFVSNVSHELKTPLTSIRMYAELLHEDRIKAPDKKRQYLRVIVDETRRLTRLVNNVLDFGRLEQGRKRYNVTALDMGRLLRDLWEVQSLQLEQCGLAADLVLPDEPPVVRVDRDAMEQVMLNILDNAVKYAAGGKALTVVLHRWENGCRIRVMDRGPGIPEGHRRKIFEQFHRVDDSLTAAKPGSGLGLSIARRLLTDMGGDLRFEPREGGGSAFIITIP
jgi:signal transduction histidine kinase